MNIYVSTTGSDQNPGTLEAPFLTLERAREAARQAEDGAVVYIRGGRYCFSGTFVLDDRDSNTQYRAYHEETVSFDGGVRLDPAKARVWDGRIQVIDLAPYPIRYGEYGPRGFRRTYVNAPNELFINGEPYTVAQYPKGGKKIPFAQGDIIDPGARPAQEDYSMKKPVLRCRDPRIQNWAGAKDAYIGGLPHQSWADDCIPIEKIRGDTITLAQPHIFGFAVTGHSSWYIVNLLEELTEPGEYYVDRAAKKLYFIPKGDIADAQIILSSLDKVMVAVENAQNVVIDGITFENSRNSGVYIQGGSGVTISRCTFRNLGILAVQIGQGAEPQPHGKHTCHGVRAPGIPVPKPISREMGSWHEYLYEFMAWDNDGGHDHTITGCHIYDTGAGGILLSGGSRKTLERGGNRVENCHIHHTNRLDRTYKAGVNMMGVGNSVHHCEIHDMAGMAIYLHGNDHIIEYNKIYDVVREVSDCGAIYMGRDMSQVGNVFRYNFFYHIHNPYKTGLGVAAIYMDDGTIYNMVYGNYFYDIVSDGEMFFTPIYWTQGGQTSVANNIFIDCLPAVNPNIGHNAYDRMHEDPLIIRRIHTADGSDMRGVDITSAVYREKYPYLYRTYTEDFAPGTCYWNNDVYTNQYTHFQDKDSLNFNFTPKQQQARDEYLSPVRITDVIWGYENKRIPYEKINFDSIGIEPGKCKE